MYTASVIYNLLTRGCGSRGEHLPVAAVPSVKPKGMGHQNIPRKMHTLITVVKIIAVSPERCF